MSNLSDLYPSGGSGGGLKPRFKEFLTSGTFTPTQALIDAGGMITVFLVGSGGSSNRTDEGGSGGEVLESKMTLTGIAGCNVIIGASVQRSNGVDSVFNGANAGGQNITAKRGVINNRQEQRMGSGWGGWVDDNVIGLSAGNGTNGFGAGGGTSSRGGVREGAPNSGQGAALNIASGSGYCLITWWE